MLRLWLFHIQFPQLSGLEKTVITKKNSSGIGGGVIGGAGLY